MAKRRRQDSSRASWLAMKSEKSIGRILVQMPPGERKSGMPHSVEMPAPVNGTMTLALVHKRAQAGNGGLHIGRDHAMSRSGRPAGRPAQARGRSMKYLHTMLRVRNLDEALHFYVRPARA